MLKELDFLRELNLWSVALRLMLAMVFGGLIGLERGRKGRAAGFRTYMMVCLGAALTMVLGQYEGHMLATVWKETAGSEGVRADVCRIGAQVINGIGFLGAGTIIVTRHQEVKGLTTAAGLWASACVGLAIGAGFYEAVLLAFLAMFLSIRILTPVENRIVENARNMNLYVEFESLDDIGRIISKIKEQGAHIYEVDIDHGRNGGAQYPSAVFYLALKQKKTHTQTMAAISELEHVRMINEIM